MDPKLTILFMLIGSIIALSHLGSGLGGGMLGRISRLMPGRRRH